LPDVGSFQVKTRTACEGVKVIAEYTRLLVNVEQTQRVVGGLQGRECLQTQTLAQSSAVNHRLSDAGSSFLRLATQHGTGNTGSTPQKTGFVLGRAIGSQRCQRHSHQDQRCKHLPADMWVFVVWPCQHVVSSWLLLLLKEPVAADFFGAPG